MQKIVAFIMIILAFVIGGCSKASGANVNIETIRTGSEGITVSFAPNNPPPVIHIDSSYPDNTFTATIEIRNKGAYPQPDDIISPFSRNDRIFISGYDPNIIEISVREQQNSPFVDLGKLALEGKSTINANGAMDIVTLTGRINHAAMNVKVYEPILLATACYHYETTAEQQVCIDPIPYSTIETTQKKICQVQDKELISQGAPVAVTKLDSEAFAAKTQFKITIKNIGSGDVVKSESITKCNPPSSSGTESGKVERGDLDRVRLEHAMISGVLLSCGPFADDNVRSTSGYIKLINGEGYVICELPSTSYATTKNEFTTPMTIKLSYGYRTSTQTSLKIIKEN